MKTFNSLVIMFVMSCCFLFVVYTIKSEISVSSELFGNVVKVLYFILSVNTLYILVTAVAVAMAGGKKKN